MEAMRLDILTDITGRYMAFTPPYCKTAEYMTSFRAHGANVSWILND